MEKGAQAVLELKVEKAPPELFVMVKFPELEPEEAGLKPVNVTPFTGE